MNTIYLLTIAAALVAAPMAFAHEPAGTYKNYCEDVSEWNVHEYGPAASGVLLQGYEDGNVAGDCNGSGLDVGTGGPGAPANHKPCPGGDWDVVILAPNPPGGAACFDLPFADYDGHAEYARGGAWLLSCDAFCGDGYVDPNGVLPSVAPGSGDGSLVCFGDAAHHGSFVTVDDVVLLNGAAFSVAADQYNQAAAAAGLPQECGDFESDVGQDCVGSCTVLFGAGLDGSYQVYVQGSQGHVVA